MPVVADVYVYEVEIVAELPENKLDFVIKDSDGNAIEGAIVGFNSAQFSGDWVKELVSVTDETGRCVIKNFPNTKNFWMNVPFRDENVLSKEVNAKSEKLQQVYRREWEPVTLPSDPVGYTVEIILAKYKGGKNIKRQDKIKVFDSQGQRFDRSGNPVKVKE